MPVGTSFVLLSLVIGLAARAESARLRLSVPVHGVSHVAFYAAKEKGYFQEEGLDVEVILMSGAIGIRASDCRRCRRQHGWRIRAAADLSRRSAANAFHQFR